MLISFRFANSNSNLANEKFLSCKTVERLKLYSFYKFSLSYLFGMNACVRVFCLLFCTTECAIRVSIVNKSSSSNKNINDNQHISSHIIVFVGRHYHYALASSTTYTHNNNAGHFSYLIGISDDTKYLSITFFHSFAISPSHRVCVSSS